MFNFNPLRGANNFEGNSYNTARTVVGDSITAVALSYLAMYTADNLGREFRDLSGLLRLAPVVIGILWIVRRCLGLMVSGQRAPQPQQNNHYPMNQQQPYQQAPAAVYVPPQPVPGPFVHYDPAPLRPLIQGNPFIEQDRNRQATPNPLYPAPNRRPQDNAPRDYVPPRQSQAHHAQPAVQPLVAAFVPQPAPLNQPIVHNTPAPAPMTEPLHRAPDRRPQSQVPSPQPAIQESAVPPTPPHRQSVTLPATHQNLPPPPAPRNEPPLHAAPAQRPGMTPPPKPKPNVAPPSPQAPNFPAAIGKPKMGPNSGLRRDSERQDVNEGNPVTPPPAIVKPKMGPNSGLHRDSEEQDGNKGNPLHAAPATRPARK